MESQSKAERRLRDLIVLRRTQALTVTESVEFVLLSSDPIRRHLNAKGTKHIYRVGESLFPTYGKAQWERYRRALTRLVKITGGSLAGLREHGFPMMPTVMRRQAEAALNKEKPVPAKPRGGWKWSPDAKARLRESRKPASPAPRKRGYPLYELGSQIPPTGHRFTVTRETLEKLTLPPGME